MADPLTEIFGRRPFRGTGAVQDYFPEAPDLSYLRRPAFIPRDAGYNPNLDPENLAAAGFSPRNIMRLQGIRQDLHAQAEQERIARDEGSALDALTKLDPANRNFSTQLLDIFRKNPRASQSKNVLGQVDLLSRFAPKAPTWSVEDIEDPDVYDIAVREGWSTLTPAEARRRANKAMTQRQMRGELASLGLSKQELDRDWSQEDYLREKGRLMRETKARTGYDLPLSGDAKTEFESIVQDLAKIQSGNYSPSEEEKKAFLPPGKKEWTEAEWSQAWNDARAAKLQEAQDRMRQFQQTYGEYYKLPAGLIPASPQASVSNPWHDRTTAGPQAVPATTTVSETVTPSEVTETVQEQIPATPRDEEAEKMWLEYTDLENTERVDGNSTNPSDAEANREIRGDKKKLQESLMKRLKIPDTDAGRKLFHQMWQGRKNSMAEGSDSRGNFLREPLRKTGVTGNAWVIRPA